MIITILSREVITSPNRWRFHVSASDASAVVNNRPLFRIQTSTFLEPVWPSPLGFQAIYWAETLDPFYGAGGNNMWRVQDIGGGDWVIDFTVPSSGGIVSPAAYFTDINDWTSMEIIASSGIPTFGETVNVKVQSSQDAALFLATDFLDLSGINNGNMYRNPQNINYFDPTAPVPGVYSNSCVFICKNTVGGGDNIKSYNTTAGGFTNGDITVNPGWEWWERGFLVRDSNTAGKNQGIYNYLVNNIKQNDSTCAWYPATKAINGIGPIAGSCAVTPPTPGGVVTVTYLNGSGTLNAYTTLPFAATQTLGLPYTFNVTFTASSSAYQFTTAQLAAISLSSPGGCTITSRTTGGSYYSDSNGYSQITLTISDPNFGPAGTETLTFSGADALVRYAVTVRNTVYTSPASSYDGYKLSYGEGPYPPGKVNFDIKNETLSTIYVRLTTHLNGVTTGTGQLNEISPGTLSLYCNGTSPINYSSSYLAIAAGDTINVDMYQNSGYWGSGSYLGIAAFPNSSTTNTVDELLVGQI
jgi:hypothetical protein